MKLNELEGFPELGNTIVIDGIEYVKKREPLSDEAIAKLWWNNYVGTADSVRNFARGIEKAHGIGENDE